MKAVVFIHMDSSIANLLFSPLFQIFVGKVLECLDLDIELHIGIEADRNDFVIEHHAIFSFREQSRIAIELLQHRFPVMGERAIPCKLVPHDSGFIDVIE